MECKKAAFGLVRSVNDKALLYFVENFVKSLAKVDQKLFKPTNIFGPYSFHFPLLAQHMPYFFFPSPSPLSLSILKYT